MSDDFTFLTFIEEMGKIETIFQYLIEINQLGLDTVFTTRTEQFFFLKSINKT